MIHIAICDDEEIFRQNLQRMLLDYAQQTGAHFHISLFQDGLALTEADTTQFDLIFLDIQMALLNGLRTAEEIRKTNEAVSIIFLTSLAQYALEGYQYQATNYIVKPLQAVRLKAEMDKWLGRRSPQEAPCLLVENDAGKYKILLRDLAYAETFNRNLMLHTEQKNILCYTTMKELETQLIPQSFVRCHSGYLVNLLFVKGVKKLQLELLGGQTLPISQPRRKEVMARLAEFWGNLL